MINLGIHREIHGKLMQKKHPTSLWGSPFENAWVGFVLNNHKDKDETALKDILDYFNRWIRPSSISDILKEERNIAAMSLYIGIIFDLKKHVEEQIQTSVMNKIIELNRKERGKFGLFNSPEIFYSTVVGLAMSETLKGELREILLKHALDEVKNAWYNKIHRFALYSAALLELKVEDVIEKIVKFLASIDIKELRADEIVPLLWLIVKYNEDILKGTKAEASRKLIDDQKEKLWKQFENQYTYFSYEPLTLSEEIEIETRTGTIYSLSTFELAMIDDFLACEEKVYKIDPNVVFDLLQLHSVIKKASEKLFKDRHYAPAIFEAYKALINHIKEKSGQKTLDGQALMRKVFDVEYDKETLEIRKRPILQLNELRTREDMDEQQGFMHLFIGAVMGIRNPKAHGIIEQKDPFKTLEYLSFASLLAKRVDEAKLNIDT